MNVLSLFDGISCGLVALERAGIPVERYVAYEIDETAISISKKNYPNIEHCGDVTTADFSQYAGFDLIMGGFPCQDLSINKANRQGLKGSRSSLFWVLARAIATVKPRYFLVENNYGMPQEDMDTITETLGVKPVLINSALVSPQRRMRLYWTNIPSISQPADRHLNVIDIIEKADRENLIEETRFNGKQEISERQDKPLRIGTIGKGGQGERVYSVYGKTVNLTANGGGRGAKTGLYLIDGAVRKLTPTEAERAQTLPDGYTAGHTDSARYKAIGNGWTVDVIAHILKGIRSEEINKEDTMVNLTTEEAIKELSRYTDQEFYTPQNRAAHQMAIEALERSWWIPTSEKLPEQYVIIDDYGLPEPLEFVVMIQGAKIPTVLSFDGKDFYDDRDGQIYDVTHWMPLPEAPDHQSNQEHTGCEWCEPGHEVCGTCERFFSGLATGCATESTDEKCAVYVPADHCMKCGRSLRSPAGNDQK